MGGVGEAARNMPYGITQPSVSQQMLKLEDELGKPLYHRRPFQLTAAGELLYEFVKPFFGNVGRVCEAIRGDGLSNPARGRFPHGSPRISGPDHPGGARSVSDPSFLPPEAGTRLNLRALCRARARPGHHCHRRESSRRLSCESLLPLPLTLLAGPEVNIESAENCGAATGLSTCDLPAAPGCHHALLPLGVGTA